MRNRVTSELRKAKQNFFNQLHHAEPKTFWKLYKALTRKQSNIPVLQHLVSGVVTDSHDKANILNSQFFKNFNSTNLSDESVNIDVDSFSLPDTLLCSEEEIQLYLRALDVKKSTGADGISALMLKRTAHVISLSLKILFNRSLTTGKFPRDWKFARVVPVPESGARDNPANYRPISLLPIISKVFERHIFNFLKGYLSDHSPLSPHQWGFTAKKSTTSAVLSLTHNCL